MDFDLVKFNIERQHAINKITHDKSVRTIINADKYTRKSYLEPYRYEIITMYLAGDSLELIATHLEISKPLEKKPARSTISRYLKSIGVSRG